MTVPVSNTFQRTKPSHPDYEHFTGTCPTCQQPDLCARVRELEEALEAHDLHVGMASKARDASIRNGRAAWLDGLLAKARTEQREADAREVGRFIVDSGYDALWDIEPWVEAILGNGWGDRIREQKL